MSRIFYKGNQFMSNVHCYIKKVLSFGTILMVQMFTHALYRELCWLQLGIFGRQRRQKDASILMLLPGAPGHLSAPEKNQMTIYSVHSDHINTEVFNDLNIVLVDVY